MRKAGTIVQSKPYLDSHEQKAVAKAMQSSWIAEGPGTRAIELRLSKYLGSNGCVMVSSGTSALFLALKALRLPGGSAVAIPSYACMAVYSAVTLAGHRAVIADIDAQTLGLSEETVDTVLKRCAGVKALILVHPFGTPLAAVRRLSRMIPVIEDCAQAFGARVNRHMAGTIGTAGVFSFYATKLLTCAEGGMVCSNRKTLVSFIRRAKNPDMPVRLGDGIGNFKSSDIAASILNSQLDKWEWFLSRRRHIASLYDSQLCAERFGFRNYDFNKHPDAVPYRYLLHAPSKRAAERCMRLCVRQGVLVDRPVAKPVHHYVPAAAAYCRNSQRAWETVMSIPLYPALSDADVNKVIDVMNKSVRAVCR